MSKKNTTKFSSDIKTSNRDEKYIIDQKAIEMFTEEEIKEIIRERVKKILDESKTEIEKVIDQQLVEINSSRSLWNDKSTSLEFDGFVKNNFRNVARGLIMDVCQEWIDDNYRSIKDHIYDYLDEKYGTIEMNAPKLDISIRINNEGNDGTWVIPTLVKARRRMEGDNE